MKTKSMLLYGIWC